MFRTRFSPITARPTRPMSDAFVILRKSRFIRVRPCSEVGLVLVRLVRLGRTTAEVRPPRETSRNNWQYATQNGCASGSRSTSFFVSCLTGFANMSQTALECLHAPMRGENYSGTFAALAFRIFDRAWRGGGFFWGSPRGRE